MVTSRFSSRSRSYSLTTIFIAINVVVYLLYLTFAIYSLLVPSTSLINLWSTVFTLNAQRVIEDGSFWTLFSSMFAHNFLIHLLFNMVSLFFVGSFVERLIGKRRFFWLYIISGLVAGIFFVSLAYIGTFFSWGSAVFGSINIPALGASGALFGLAGFLAVLLPRLRVLLFFFLPMSLWVAMVLLVAGLWIFSVYKNLPIGNTAHLGGLVVGLAYGWYIRTKYGRKVALLGRMFR